MSDMLTEHFTNLEIVKEKYLKWRKNPSYCYLDKNVKMTKTERDKEN